MRLDRELRNDVRSKWIQALFQDLNLAGSEDTPISALSGGERKRLSLAVEVPCYAQCSNGHSFLRLKCVFIFGTQTLNNK
jgi:ABC-type lipopolysaccharide export system ATPase subunit